MCFYPKFSIPMFNVSWGWLVLTQPVCVGRYHAHDGPLSCWSSCTGALILGPYSQCMTSIARETLVPNFKIWGEPMCKIFQDLCIYLVTLDILCGLNESKFNLLMEQNWHKINYWTYKLLIFKMGIYDCSPPLLYINVNDIILHLLLIHIN